jgi:hypothetical protein
LGYAIHKSLGGWRASGHIDVNRNNAINSSHNRLQP